MHLNHQIPWSSLAECLEFRRRRDPVASVTGVSTAALGGDLCVRKGRDVRKPLRSFVHCFRKALRSFAESEVARVENDNHCRARDLAVKASRDAPLFPDALLDLSQHAFRLGPFDTNNNHCNSLDTDRQRLSYWVERAGGPSGMYTTAQGDLSDALKLLIELGESEAVLRLARAPPHLTGIMSMGWGHSFGVNHLAFETLRRYLVLNIGDAVRQRSLDQEITSSLGKGPAIDRATGLPRGVSPRTQLHTLYDICSLRRYVYESFTDYDYSAQFIMHRAFWEKYADPTSDATRALSELCRQSVYASPSTAPGEESTSVPDDPTVTDGQRTRQYLADCFRALYLIDMLLVERHTDDGDTSEADAFWEEEIPWALQNILNLPKNAFDSDTEAAPRDAGNEHDAP